jgi:phospholipase C
VIIIFLLLTLFTGTDWNQLSFGQPITLLSVFETLDIGNSEPSWKIYEQDKLTNQKSLCLAKDLDYVIKNDNRVLSFDRFLSDIGTPNQLKYSFIVPHLCPESQHPGCKGANVSIGDQFLGQIYNAMKHSRAWFDTLLVITYDEHGGYWDSVMPYGVAVSKKNF